MATAILTVSGGGLILPQMNTNERQRFSVGGNAGFSILSAMTILLVSANTIAMSVRERTREMAILRTLGYTPAEILRLVLGEAVVISLFGGVGGLAIGYLLGRGLQASPANFGFTGIKWQASLIVLGMAALIGVVAALVPALVAARKNVVESLRFTG